MAVDVTTAPEFRFSEARVLPIHGFRDALSYRNFDPTADGDKFLVVLPADDTEPGEAARRIEIILNWTEELKARVPAR